MDNSLLCIHRNNHFDTMKRLHPLLHPLNTGDAPLHPVIGLDYSSFFEERVKDGTVDQYLHGAAVF